MSTASTIDRLAGDLAVNGHASCPLIWDGHATTSQAVSRARSRLRRAARRAGVTISTASGWHDVYATVQGRTPPP